MTTTRQAILDLLSTGQLNQRKIAKSLGKTEATISYHIKRLIKEGKVSGTRSTSKFLNISSKFPSNLDTTPLSKSRITNEQAQANTTSQAIRQSIHHINRYYEIEGQASLGSQARELRLRNNMQYFADWHGLTLRLTTRSMAIEGLEILAPLAMRSPELLAQAEERLDGLAEQAARENGIRIKRTQACECGCRG